MRHGSPQRKKAADPPVVEVRYRGPQVCEQRGVTTGIVRRPKLVEFGDIPIVFDDGRQHKLPVMLDLPPRELDRVTRGAESRRMQ